MDYEKKYKQLHTLISDLYPFMSEYCKEKVEGFLPELKKSEDEKIIDAIKHGLKCLGWEHINGIRIVDILTWLEKQGEKETDEWKEGNIIRHGGIIALVIKGRRAMKSNGEIFTVQYPDEWVKALPIEIEHFFNEFEKLGEEKPSLFETPETPIKDTLEVSSRMQSIDDDLKPIADFIINHASWNLHKEEWSCPTLTVPLFRVLDALIQRGKPYIFRG